GADHVYDVAFGKHRNVNALADFGSVAVWVHGDLVHVAYQGQLALAEVALLGLAELSGLGLAPANLHAVVAVALRGLHLGDDAWACLDYGDACGDTALFEHLGHAHLPT